MSMEIGAPYPGTRPFQCTDSDWFFGRKDDAVTLADMWRANRLTVALGPVGSGKTSLLLAGAFPLVMDQRSDVLLPGRLSYGSTFPFAALPERNPYTVALLGSWSQAGIAGGPAGLTLRDFVRRRAQRHSGVILAAIDQMEDLRANSGPRRLHRRRFLRELAALVRDEPRLHLLLMIREDSADLLREELGDGARYRVRPLTRDGAIEAVKEPLAGTDRSFTDEAAEELVLDLQVSHISPAGGDKRHLADRYVEPSMLQVVCSRLWADLPSYVKTITARHVRTYGDAGSALAAHWSQQIATVADEHKLTAKRLRSWLLSHLVTELGARASIGEGLATTEGMPNAVVRALVERHLLAAELHDGARRFELLSPRLIEPLRQATDENPPAPEPSRYLREAGQALTLGELDLAEQYANCVLETSLDTDLPLRARTSALLGNVAYEREKPIEAESSYREAADLFEAIGDTGAVARLLAAIGQTLVAQGCYQEAVTELRSAVGRMTNDTLIQTELALALWQLGEGQAAVAVLTDVLGVDGGNLEALRARGEIFADLGDGRNAMLDLNRVASQAIPSVQAARGLALAELGDQPAASQVIDDVVDETTRNGTVLLYAARARALGGDKAAAKELASRAADATDPALPPPHRDLALQLAGRTRLR
jgi:tetratricopeptide (TPR) repeat protein